jgi:hypothetical protein
MRQLKEGRADNWRFGQREDLDFSRLRAAKLDLSFQ